MIDENNDTDPTPETSPFNRAMARIVVGAYDDAQSQRTAMMNRIRDLVRKRNEDIPFDEVEEEKDAEDRDYDAKYADDNLFAIIDEMREEGKLSKDEYRYLNEILEAAQAAARVENKYQDIMRVTKAEPIFTEWLEHVYGVSHTITARLIHQFGYCEDPEREKVSNLWSYAGLAPGQKRVRGEKLGYNPEAKRLAWLVADGMIKQGDRSRYRKEFYDPYKSKQMERMETAEAVDDYEVRKVENGDGHMVNATYEVLEREDPDDPESAVVEYGEKLFNGSPPNSRGHADLRARRYLSKKFLKHYHAISRSLVGLETRDEWIITHGGHDKIEDSFENPFHALKVLQPAEA